MIKFTESQNKAIAAGITSLSVMVVIAFVTLIFIGIGKCLSFLSPAITPVVLGLFLSMLFKPYYVWWKKQVKNPSIAVICMLTSILLPSGLLIYTSGAVLLNHTFHLISMIPDVVVKLSEWVNSTFPEAHTRLASWGIPSEHLLFFTEPARYYKELSSTIASSYGDTMVKTGFGLVKYVMGLGSYLIMLIFFVYFLMRESLTGKDYVNMLPFLKDDTKKFVAQQIDSFSDILVNFFQRQVLICLIEGCYYGVGFLLAGLPGGFVLGFLLGVLNLIPLFGTIVVLPFALLIGYFGAGCGFVVFITVLVVWAAGQVFDGYLITPKIQGDKTGLGYAGVIFSFFFWGVVFQSLMGLLLAIPLSAFCVVFWRAVKERYIRGII
ncbi:MAG: AI-2E family transporter [Kiritimatiellae bacterium]|nr:AI-2E family transporter [Kiritimatiellia bacterium]